MVRRWSGLIAPAVAAGAWIAVVVFGYGITVRYESEPGRAAAPPTQWPADAPLSRDSAAHTLLLFVHPQCPCTSATVEELARLLTRHGAQLASRVVFYGDDTLGPDFLHGDLWQQVERIPGVAFEVDHGARLARRFGAWTSGEVLVYSPAGRLEFAGGITPGRGHEGDSAGAAAIAALLVTPPAEAARAPTFGCAIRVDDAPCEPPR